MKNPNRIEIAVYGKGGIGKSTVSANLSAAMALEGRRVLQIGCDPKHDSTRLLMHGENVPTVLEYLKSVNKENADPSQILMTGFENIGCIEAGGPRPGVGCAGRGIISCFEFLEKHHVKEQYDTVLYDVLGDVVCGGFAVPVRREYADVIFLVTSGEYMALYAANNILRGIRNYDGDQHKRVAGIIYNERKLDDEDGRVERFAKAVGLPILVKVPRSNAFAKAELANMTLAEMANIAVSKSGVTPASGINCFTTETQVFKTLAGMVNNDMPLYPATPLSDEDLEAAVLKTNVLKAGSAAYVGNDDDGNDCVACADHCPDSTEESSAIRNYVNQNTNTQDSASATSTATDSDAANKEYNVSNAAPINRQPLYGCAFNGAATCGIHLTDALIIAHSPRACAFYTWQNISSTGRKNLFNRGILMPSAISPHFECTEIGQAEAVFGGTDKLKAAVLAAIERKPGAVVIISSCVSGIIGDDLKSMEELSTPDCPIITIPADGDIAGDYMEGIRMCMYTLAERLIDPSVTPAAHTVEESSSNLEYSISNQHSARNCKEQSNAVINPAYRCVNFVNETGVSFNHTINYKTIKELLGKMGIRVNCRFLGDATVDDMRHFLRAPLNILADDTPDGRALEKWLKDKYGCTFASHSFPVGAKQTAAFLYEIAEFFGCSEMVPGIIKEEEERYKQELRALRPILKGKRLVLTTINANMDYLLEALDYIGVEIVKIGVVNYLHQEIQISDTPEKYPIDKNFDWTNLYDQINPLNPDIVISNFTPPVTDGDYVKDVMPMTPCAGFNSGLAIVKRWADLLGKRREGGWMNDRKYFEMYQR